MSTETTAIDATRYETSVTCTQSNTLDATDRYLTVNEARQGWRALELDQLWRYRHLLWMFMWRDLKAQQKQTVLGFAWIVLGPLVSVAMMTVVFSRMLKVPSDGAPYSVFLFAGQFLWSQFSMAYSGSIASVVTNANFIQKVYVPRLIFPIASSLSGLVNICIAFPIMLIVMLCLGQLPCWTVILCPFIILLTLATGIGFGLWLAPLYVTYRDIGRIAGYALMLGFYATPILYPLSVVPAQYHWLVALNPMAGYISTFRTCLYGAPFEFIPCVASIAFTLTLVISGSFFFTRLQGRFADVI
jgi:homopolymeric O-antigen transport system permease protein